MNKVSRLRVGCERLFYLHWILSPTFPEVPEPRSLENRKDQPENDINSWIHPCLVIMLTPRNSRPTNRPVQMQRMRGRKRTSSCKIKQRAVRNRWMEPWKRQVKKHSYLASPNFLVWQGRSWFLRHLNQASICLWVLPHRVIKLTISL